MVPVKPILLCKKTFLFPFFLLFSACTSFYNIVPLKSFLPQKRRNVSFVRLVGRNIPSFIDLLFEKVETTVLTHNLYEMFRFYITVFLCGKPR